jgi:signal transduction histidine kinase
MTSTTPTSVSASPPEAVPAGALRILIVEDSAADTELEVEKLRDAGYACRWDRVEAQADFLTHLEQTAYDLIIADYSLPTFNGLTALELVRGRALDVPFILISGILGEERAIESLKAGATDYVMKGRIERLGPVVQRALRERDERRHRQHAEEALKRRTAELEAANRELEAFSSAVSHDLRNPLSRIFGYADLLEEHSGSRLDATGQDNLRKLRCAAEHMRELIEDLLRLSHVALSEMHWQPVDLTVLAQSIAAELQQRQPERALEFVIQAGLTAYGDPPLLRVALGNLLGNAWKYTSTHSTARIDVGMMAAEPPSRGDLLLLRSSAPLPRCSSAIFFVRDDGVGFDMARAGTLFTPFHRLHSVREFEGTGVGLATVERIIRRHGGRVWAEAEVGRGATFYFSLPVV